MWNLTIFLSGICIAASFYRLHKYCTFRPIGFPPGPPRIPIFGSYLFLKLINRKYLHKAVAKLCEYYKTNVLGFYFGPFAVITTNDYKGAKEIMLRSEFDGRLPNFLAKLRVPNFEDNKGIFFNEGDYWKDQRWFTLRYLRDHGFGRRDPIYEGEVNDEIQKFIGMLKNGPSFEHEKQFMRPGGLCQFPNILIPTFANCYLQTLVGERVERSEQYKSLKAAIGAKEFSLIANEFGNLLSIVPWIRHIFPNLSKYDKLRQYAMDLHEFAQEIVQKYVDSYEDGRVRNFLDMYIKEIKSEENGGPKFGYLQDQLNLIVTDMLLAAMSGMEITISALFQNLLHKPRVLMRIQNEIDEVVGSGRLPNLDDRINMPYCEATLREALRYETLNHSNVPHRATDDTTLMRYKIPKNTAVFPAIYPVNHEKAIWGDPENFRPERFLDDNGKLCLKKDLSLPFSGGKRLCPGETFARNTMFLFYTAILQNFNIRTPDGSLPDISKRRCGFVTGPEDFWLILDPK